MESHTIPYHLVRDISYQYGVLERIGVTKLYIDIAAEFYRYKIQYQDGES